MAHQNLALVGVASNTATLISYTHRACNDKSVQYVGTNSEDSLAAPRIIDVKLDVKAPGLTGNDRATVSIKHTVLDSDNLPHTGSATLTLSLPRVSQFTEEYAVSLLKQMADYLAGVSATVSGQTDTSGFPAKWAQMLIP
jgi:hypothetical protein